jgi:protein-disulfide isomerase
MDAASTATRRTLPGAGAGITVGVLAVAAILCWRFAPAELAGLVAAVAVAVSWVAGRRLDGDRRWLEHASALPLVVSALLLFARHEPRWWPCDLACAGGHGYELLFGVPVVGLAFGACLALQVALGGCHLWCRPKAADADRPLPTPLIIQAAAWALIGGSLFFLWTAERLDLTCRQCFAFHTAVLTLIGPLRRGHLRALPRLAALAVGFLALLAAYGPALRVDLAPPEPHPHPPTDQAEAQWSERADAGRAMGRAEAPLTLELAIDFQCPHCAEEWDALVRALAPAIGDGRARVVVRHVVRKFEPASESLARWAFAAAAEGRHRAFVAAMLGSRAGASADELLHGPNAQAIDLEAIARTADAHQAGVAERLADDHAALKRLGFAGKTPLAVLLARSGKELGRWSGDFDAAAVASTIAAASGTPGQEQR